MALAKLPRAVRNQNPGNIERGHDDWAGLCEPDQMTADQREEKRFCVFRNARYGFRALAVILHNYFTKHDIKTVRGIINRFAPASENNSEAYIKHVCDAIGEGPDSVLDMNDPETIKELCRAIAVHESGGWFFEQKDLDDGVGMALSTRVPKLIS